MRYLGETSDLRESDREVRVSFEENKTGSGSDGGMGEFGLGHPTDGQSPRFREN